MKSQGKEEMRAVVDIVSRASSEKYLNKMAVVLCALTVK